MSHRRPTLTLCALRAAGLAIETPLPTRLVVCPWGTQDVGSRGRVIVDERTVAAFAAHQKTLGRDGLVAADFDHNTVEGTASYSAEAEPRKVAGWGTVTVEPGVGIVVDGLRYTPEGKAALEGGHYQDISPAVIRDADGVVLGLHSFAFCRHGQIENFTISLAAARGRTHSALSAFAADLSPSSMKPTAELIALLAALGITLDNDAEDSAIAAALTEGASKITEMVSAMGAGYKKEPEAMSVLTAKVDALTVQIGKIEGERDTLKREQLLARAAAEGKVIPLSADSIKVTPLTVLEDLVNQAKPGQVPTGTLKKAAEKGGEVEAFSAESLATFDRFGLTADEVKQLTATKAA